MRFFITLSYDGTRYHGWQIQPNGISVQEVLQQALSTLLRHEIEIVGAGRTDAGVHAKMMVAHFDLDVLQYHQIGFNLETNNQLSVQAFIDCQQLVYKLNKLLPSDIAVQKIESVPEDMHARFSATSRTYHYFIHTCKDPFRRAYSWQSYGTIDFDRMNEAAMILLDYTDFTSFSKVNTDTKTNNCIITKAVWEQIDQDVWRFTITANRFLRNMVRAIVGTLVDVGRGKLSIEDFRKVIEDKNRCRAGESVPGNALFLVDIKY